MKLAALLVLASLSAHAADGGLDVELLDAGTVLTDALVCMRPADAQTLDLGLRSAEKERDGLKVAVIATSTAAAVATVAAIVAAGVCAAKK